MQKYFIRYLYAEHTWHSKPMSKIEADRYIQNMKENQGHINFINFISTDEEDVFLPKSVAELTIMEMIKLEEQQ